MAAASGGGGGGGRGDDDGYYYSPGDPTRRSATGTVGRPPARRGRVVRAQLRNRLRRRAAAAGKQVVRHGRRRRAARRRGGGRDVEWGAALGGGEVCLSSLALTLSLSPFTLSLSHILSRTRTHFITLFLTRSIALSRGRGGGVSAGEGAAGRRVSEEKTGLCRRPTDRRRGPVWPLSSGGDARGDTCTTTARRFLFRH